MRRISKRELLPKELILKSLGYVGAFFACLIMSVATGCASGGFKLTRKYAQFVNKQNIIIRIVLYILTGVVFAVTMLIDLVVFNTIDFWQGKVSAGEYKFKEGEKSFHVRHEITPKNLKRSQIEIFNQDQALIQTVVLEETSTGEIELFVDGQLRTKVRDISGLPIASIYDARGKFVSENLILVESALPQLAATTK